MAEMLFVYALGNYQLDELFVVEMTLYRWHRK